MSSPGWREVQVHARDGAAIWLPALVLASLARIHSSCWRWSDVGWFWYFGLASGVLLWIGACLLSSLVASSRGWLSRWGWPVVPYKELDDRFPAIRDSVEYMRASLRRDASKLVRFGVVMVMLTGALMLLGRLPSCPDWANPWSMFPAWYVP